MNSRYFLANTLTVLFSLFFTIGINSQTYQRTFPSSERSTFTVCNSPTSGGGYYLVGVFDDGMGEFGLTVSKHDPKGTLSWGADYLIEDATYAVGVKTIECTTISSDTLVIAALNANNLDEKLIIVCEPEAGMVAWSGTISNSDDLIQPFVSAFVEIEEDLDGNINYFSSHNLDTLSGVHFEKISTDQSSLVSRSYFSFDEDTLASDLVYLDATTTQDTGYLVISTLEVDGNVNGVLKLDRNGDVLWSKTIATNDTLPGTLQLNAIVETPDSGFAATGIFLDIANNPVVLVVKADSLGDVQWSREINMLSLNALILNQAIDLIITTNEEILVAGKALDLLAGTVADYTIFFDQFGTVQRQFIYGGGFSFWLDTNLGLQLSLNDLSQTTDGNILMSTTGIDFQFMNFVPIAVKMDQLGDAFCQDTLPLETAFDFPMVSDTLMIGDTLMAVRGDLEVEFRVFDDYTVPVVTLQDTMFCPQDPIIYTLDATTEDAIEYLWSTGDTTPTITVMEAGDYDVIVTIDDRICFTLCDTATVSQQEFPEAILNFRDQFCESRNHQLSAGSTTDISGGVIWAPGGEVTPSIIVPAEPGVLYSVTITDSCENSAEASFTLPENPTQSTSINVNNDLLCSNGVITLDAISDSQFEPFEYMWSNGELTSGIEIAAPGGTFSVTLTDACDLVDSFTVTIPASDFELPDPAVDITIANNVSVANCGLSLVADGIPGSENIPIETLLWSTNETTQEIFITEVGIYTVTVTDICGQTATNQVNITEPIVIPGPSVEINETVDQANCGIGLSADASASGDGNITSILWTDGSNTNTIFIDMPGMFGVTVTDNCGNTAEDVIAITEGDLELPLPVVSIGEPDLPDSCFAQLVANVNDDHPIAIQTILWSTGEITESIQVLTEGDFSVTVTDVCGNTDDASVLIENDMVLDFPNIFFPRSELHEENRSFGPFIRCDVNVQDYNFEIFNRWGKRVFQTNDTVGGSARWNGQLNNTGGNILEEDVYLWQASWVNTIGNEVRMKGDVTLAIN